MTETSVAAPAPRRGVPLWAQLIVYAVLAGLLVVVAITLKRSQQGTVQRGDKIPAFSMPLFSGYELNGNNQVNITDLRGKVVLINFWASWCKPCEQEAADLRQAWALYQPTGKVVFLGVDYVDTEPEARAYMQKFGITYANGPDLGTKVSQLFRIKGVPETYVLDQEGVLRAIKVGPFSSLDEIKSMVDPLVR